MGWQMVLVGVEDKDESTGCAPLALAERHIGYPSFNPRTRLGRHSTQAAYQAAYDSAKSV